MEEDKKYKVLIFEDDPFLKELYEVGFGEAGFRVKSFLNGKNAVKKVIREKPDIISCDIIMPGMNGWEVIKLLKKNEQTKNIPIIIVDNMCEKEDIEKGLKLGAIRHCCKAHYTPSEIIKIFKDFLGEKKVKKYCSNCGSKLKDDKMFCSQCGKKKKTYQEKDRNKIINIIYFIVFLLLGIYFIVIETWSLPVKVVIFIILILVLKSISFSKNKKIKNN